MIPCREPHLVSFSLNPVALMSIAVARKTVPPSGDLGYVIHQALTETFGSAAPKPFHLFENPNFKLLTYSTYSAAELLNLGLERKGRAKGWELASKALDLPSMEAIPLPNSWAAGTRYRFAVRTRPVTRISHAKERGLPREFDVFLHAVARKEGESWLDRQTVYLSWFADQVANAGAKLGQVRILAMTRKQVYRKGAPSLDGPDVTFTGSLEVCDPKLFSDFVGRGVGRHRAFGFGMLLLQSCGP